MGAPYIDYIVADKILILTRPSAVLRRKNQSICRTAVSSQRSEAPHLRSGGNAGQRRACRCTAWYFCLFNNSYKITPAIFSIWMRLLQQVDGSVLWLLAGNATAPDNLRAEAARRGVSPERLVFAPKMPIEDHLRATAWRDLLLDYVASTLRTRP